MAVKKISWKSLFSQAIRSRGLAYYRAGKVKKLAEEGDGSYSATVRGSRNYRVSVRIGDNEIAEMSCTCPYAGSGEACKHEAAMLYEMDAQELLLEQEDEPSDAFLNPDVPDIVGSGEKSPSKSKARAEAEDAGKKKAEASALKKAAELSNRASDERNRLLSVHESSLQELQNREEAEEQSDSDDDSFIVDNYHYYDTKSIVSRAHIQNSTMQEAKALFTEKNPPYIDRLHEGFLQGSGGMEPGGECYIEDEKKTWNVRLIYRKKEVVQSYCGRCYYTRSDSKSSFHHVPCKHEAAAILLLCSYLDDQDMTDSTDTQAAHFLQSALPQTERTQDSSLQADSEALRKVPLHFEARLETPRDDSRLYAAFYIGTNRMYKVKDLVSLLSGFQNRETQSFGKKTELYLSEDSLDEKSAKWLDFVRDEQKRFSRMKDRLRSPDEWKYGFASVVDQFKFQPSLLLDHDRLDRFYEIQEGAPVEYTCRTMYETTKTQLRLMDGKMDLKLTVSPVTSQEGARRNFEGVMIRSGVTRLFQGKDYIYQMTDSALIRISSGDQTLSEALCTACGDKGISMTVGRSYLNDFWHRVLPKLKKTADVTVEEEDYIERYIVPDPEYHFYLDQEDSVVYGQAEAVYGHARYPLGDWNPANELPVREGFRKRSGEEEIYDRFSRYLPNYDAEHHLFNARMDDDAMFNLLDHGLQELMDLGEVHVTEHFRRLKVRRSIPVRVGVSLNSGLMDISVTSSDVTPDELLQILAAYRRKNHYVRLKNGDFLKLGDNVTAASLEQMMTEMHLPLKEIVSGHMSVPAYRALYLEHMLSGMEDVYEKRDSHYRQLIRAFRSVGDSDYQVPDSLNAKLRGYQEEGYQWLRTLDEWNFGGILADEMGLGKTVQVIACLLAAKEERQQNDAQTPAAGEAKTSDESTGSGASVSIVVCPASLVYNWGEELSKFAPSLKAVLVAGTASERRGLIQDIESYDVAVTSYDLLKRDIDQYEGHSFRFAVVDEAQNMKNPTTAAAKSVKLIRAKTRFALTGTPIENRLSELWSIFDFVMPGYLYEYRTFRDEIETPVAKNNDEDASARLRRMVAPFILRRRKDDVLKDLPDKLEEVRYARMEKQQQQLYDAEVVKMKKQLQNQNDEEFRRSQIAVLAELTKIRQICCDPSLLFENYRGGSAKTEMCMDLVRSLIEGQHRALIFSQFTSMFTILEERLQEEGIPYYKITGETPKKKRLELVKDFNSGRIPLFLISLKAGGTGLNLTGADVVIHYDPWWNLAAQDQATDRAHRIGQTRTVTVFRLIVKGTIEEKIVELQESKKKLSEDILGAEGISSTALNRDDLMQLLG